MYRLHLSKEKIEMKRPDQQLIKFFKKLNFIIKQSLKSLLLLLLSRFSRVWLCATPWTAAHQAPLSRGFSRQEYQSGLSFPLALPDPGIEPASPALAGMWILYHWATWEALMKYLAQYYLLSWFEQYPYISLPRTHKNQSEIMILHDGLLNNLDKVH